MIVDASGRRHAAYRIVVAEDVQQGQYYGIQGTTWKTPPILAATHQKRRIGGRTFSLYTDGGHIRLVAWRTPKASTGCRTRSASTSATPRCSTSPPRPDG